MEYQEYQNRIQRGEQMFDSGNLQAALKLHVHRISKGAQAKVEAAGGSVELLK